MQRFHCSLDAVEERRRQEDRSGEKARQSKERLKDGKYAGEDEG